MSKLNTLKSSVINNCKIVLKPWGKEIWIALNEKYCYKRIEINAGFKTSYQYHNIKLETICVISGEAEVWLENDNGIVEKFFMKEGDSFTVIPKRKHRVIAISNVVLHEVSTPEVDDVIRINDEFKRNDGIVNDEHINPVVCIIAAGTGSRLGNISKTCHKTLLPISNKAIISHIIDNFNKNTDIIIAVGYLKEQLMEYVNLYHSDRKITFVEVDNYEGSGSGPAYSLGCCRKELQRPFYYCVSDFINNTKFENTSFSNNNWIGLFPTTHSELYSTVKTTNNTVEKIMNKSLNGYSDAFTGVFYMYNYQTFWDQFDLNVNESQELVDALLNIEIFKFQPKYLDWHDTGTIELYEKLVERIDGNNLYLHNTKSEFKYKNGDVFIKKIDTDKIKELIIRQQYLEKYTPKILFNGKYFISYEFFKGDTLYTLNNRVVYSKFLDWYTNNFIVEKQPLTNEMKIVSNKFYKEKTTLRLEVFKTKTPLFNILDNIPYINDKPIKPIEYYLNIIDWDYLTDIIPTQLWHGDLHFENIIYNGNDFKLIDWRENFGGNTQYGDLYYDLAKLYGGLLLNYLRMKEPTNYFCKINSNGELLNPAKLNETIITEHIILDHYVDNLLISFLNDEFTHFLEKNNLDFNKIKILTAVIFLNMAPLHINNFDIFLFCKAKLLFSEILI